MTQSYKYWFLPTLMSHTSDVIVQDTAPTMTCPTQIPSTPPPPPPLWDVIIVGSGPAGYCAALYCSRGALRTVVFEGHQSGGQLITTTEVENYLGFESVDGYDLTEKFRSHALAYGAQLIPRSIIKASLQQYPFVLTDDQGEVHTSRTVIIATGARAKRLTNIQNEVQYWQRGISACAVCDGALPMFRNQPLAVVGGGDTAMEESLHLSKFASQVYLIHRRNEFRASKIMLQRVKANPKIQIITDTVVTGAHGDGKQLQHITTRNALTQECKDLVVKGLFYGIGHEPATALFQNVLHLDEHGYIKTTDHTRTNIPGVFAAGDVMDKHYRQAITAAGFGCMAAKQVEEWLQQQ